MTKQKVTEQLELVTTGQVLEQELTKMTIFIIV
jgi:hypothetical protein